MNYQAMTFWWMVGLTLVNAAIGVYLYWERNNNATTKRIDEMEKDVDKRLDGHSTRLSRVESGIKGLPTHKDLADLHERINDVARDINTLTGEATGMKTTLNLIHQYLLNGGGKQ